MNRILLCMLAAAALLDAKGVTVKIAIKGAGLSKPVEMTGDKVGAFHVWAGPGVFVNKVEQQQGFIIDWQKGIVADQPTGLPLFHVEFYTSHSNEGQPKLTYVVSYAYDPATGQGFVYLPGRQDEAFQSNQVMVHGHGYEGNWFRATAEWDRFVKPMLAK